MVSLTSLWLPIVLSAVIVFVASSIIHMLLPYHHSDYRQLPKEDKTLAAMRDAGVKRGSYMFPFATPKQMKSPAMAEKFKQGPVGMMTVLPTGTPAMGKLLVLWFVFCLVINYFVAYLTGRTVAPGADYLVVFRVAGTAAFLGYGLANLRNSIWKGESWGMTIKEVIDGLIYALLTAGTFGWLWPH